MFKAYDYILKIDYLILKIVFKSQLTKEVTLRVVCF